MWRKIWGASLWVKLTAAFALVILIGALGVVFFINLITAHEFELYVTRDSARWAQWLAPQLAAYYASNGSWNGVDRIIIGGGGMPMMMGMDRKGIEQMRRQMRSEMPMMSNVDMWTGMGLRIIVADAQHKVITDTQGKLTGKTLSQSARNQALPIVVEGQPVGFVLAAPLVTTNTPEGLFLQSVTRAVLLVAIGMSILALGIAAFIAREITAPLRRLTVAAYRVARGDLSVRVPIRGDDDLARVSVAFNRMAVALEEQQRLRRRLMNDIAHELRTPLSVIQAHAEALMDGVFPPTPDNVRPIHEQTLLLRRLVNDLRELALAEAGELRMSQAPLDLATIVRHAANSMRPAAEQKDIRLEVDIVGAPLQIIGDAQRLEQVLLNLLSNAVRHTPARGTVTVRAWKEDESVHVQVRDTGPGIAPEDIPHVFERFWRGDKSRTRGTGGTGLGLAIARNWVEAHGGRIWVESQPGRGATFTFVIPLASGVG